MELIRKKQTFRLARPLGEPHLKWHGEFYEIDRVSTPEMIVWYGIETSWKWENGKWEMQHHGVTLVPCEVPVYEILYLRSKKLRSVSHDAFVDFAESNQMPALAANVGGFCYNPVKYYFVTYQATNRQGSMSVWNQVIDKSPMEFIKDTESLEISGNNAYRDFVVLNACEISKDEFKEFNGCF